MIEIFDKTRWRMAIAENARNISEQQRINAVWYLYFSLPYKDPKNEYCKPFYYVHHNGGELYRIMPDTLEADEAAMADRQRIEQTYAQGATQIYSQALQSNCEKSSGAAMDFFIPSEMQILNKVLVKVRMNKFRAYSQSTQSAVSQVITSTTSDDQTRTSSGGGGTKATSSDGGATKATSSDGDASKTTSSSGGGGTETSSYGGETTTDTGESGINVTYDYSYTEESGGHSHKFR